MAQRNDRDGFREAVHGSDIGNLRPVRVFLQVLHDLGKLSGEEAVRVGKREKKRLHVEPFGRGVRIVGGDRRLMEASIERKLVDEVRVVPCARRDG